MLNFREKLQGIFLKSYSFNVNTQYIILFLKDPNKNTKAKKKTQKKTFCLKRHVFFPLKFNLRKASQIPQKKVIV
jgi:hypothetical protein